MTNNDILRHIRYIFDYEDAQMIDIFAMADLKVSRSQVCDWLRKEDQPGYIELPDVELATFLNGFINLKRGKKDGSQPKPETKLNNNIVLRKLKIAFKLDDSDILDILELADRRISKHELSAFFRKPEQRQYRPCNDQILRNFMQGLQKKSKLEKL